MIAKSAWYGRPSHSLFSWRIFQWSTHRVAHLCVRSIALRAYACVDSPLAHSSNAMMISAPSASSTSMTDSGVKKCFDPSRCERNCTHSSVIFTRDFSGLFGFFERFFFSIWAPRENTWNPPLSVSIGSGCCMNPWSHPNPRMTSCPGCR